MKRSTYLLLQAKAKAQRAVVALAILACMGVWSVRVSQDSAALGGTCYVLTLAGLFYTLGLVRDALRYAGEADRAAIIEWEKRPIPRI